MIMADKNEPGGGVVPSAFSELKRASKADISGLATYATAIIAVGVAVVLGVLLAYLRTDGRSR